MLSHYLYRIRPAREGFLAESTPEEDAIVAQHFEYLRSLTEQGVVLLAGRTLTDDAGSHGVVVFCADSDGAARTVMNADPAVAAGVFRAELYPFRIALVSENIIHQSSAASGRTARGSRNAGPL